jgi:hypothetical protein
MEGNNGQSCWQWDEEIISQIEFHSVTKPENEYY